MNRDFITFRSITPAQRAQRLLRREGMETLLQRTPRSLEQAGCGYCLRLRPEHTGRAANLLQQEGVPFRRIFAVRDGQLEELTL